MKQSWLRWTISILFPLLIYATCLVEVPLPAAAQTAAQNEPAIGVVESSLQNGQRFSSDISVSPLTAGVTPSGPFVLVVTHGYLSGASSSPNRIPGKDLFIGSINPPPGARYHLVVHYTAGILAGSESNVVAANTGPGATTVVVTAVDENNNIITAPGSLTVGYGLNGPIDVTVKATSGTNTPTGTVSLLDEGAQIAQLPLDNAGHAHFVDCDPFSAPFCLTRGPHDLTVVYSGDANFASNSSAALAYTIGTSHPFFAVLFAFRLDNTLEIEADFDTGVTFLGIAPTGSLNFLDTVNGTTTDLGAPGLLTQSQPIVFREFNLGPGVHTISLQYSGDGNYLSATASSIPFNAPILPGIPPQITFTPPAGPLTVGQTATFTINVSSSQSSTVPTGHVDMVAGASFLARQVLTLANGSVTFQGVVPNSYTLQPLYFGDSTFAAGWGAPMTLPVSPATVPLSISSNSQSVSAGTPITLTGSFAALTQADLPQGGIQFLDSLNGGQSVPLGFEQLILSNNPAASISAVLPQGVHTITASYSGDSNYNPVSSNSVTVTVTGGNPPAFSLSTVNGGDTVTITAGQTAHFSVSLNGNGFIGVVSLSCSGAPAGMTCTALPNPANLTDTITSVNLAVTVAPSQSSAIHLREQPFLVAGVFGVALLALSGKLRRSKALLGCVVALFLVAGMAACSGGGSPPPPPTPTPTPTPTPPPTGTFKLTLKATSGSSTSSILLTLTVNP